MPRFMLPLVAMAVAAACSGEPTKENPVPRVAAKPALATAPTSATAKKVDAVVRGRSARPPTVCTRYRAQLALAQTSGNATSAAAKSRVASLRTLVADACE